MEAADESKRQDGKPVKLETVVATARDTDAISARSMPQPKIIRSRSSSTRSGASEV